MRVPIRTALLSVSDKSGLAELGRALAGRGVALISTGGTAKALRDAGLTVRDVSDVTQSPEVLRGRVKTLHPLIHAGLLADRRRDDDRDEAAGFGAPAIDLVVCNLYPFEATAAPRMQTDAAGYEEVVENIDIGGPTMIRAAAKNHANIAVVTDPAQYEPLIAELAEHDGAVSLETRRRLALAAFRRVAAYDAAVVTWLEAQAQQAGDDSLATAPPEIFVRRYDKVGDLRYGENPHQSAAFYREFGAERVPGIAAATQVHGTPLSYNNIVDADAALHLAAEFADPAVAIIKHTNPCGLAVADDLGEAFRRARAADPTSAFGGIIGINRRIERPLAEELTAKGLFFEAIVAPGFSDDALDHIRGRKAWVERLRCLAVGGERIGPGRARSRWIARGLEGGLLVQGPDAPLFAGIGADDWQVAGSVQPPADRQADLRIAWAVCKHVKSNAIVLVRDGVAIGVGAGQMSRVEATELAISRAGGDDAARGAVLASDAFFPFPDSIDRAAKAGITAVIQPGGSKRDAEVIAAADGHGIAMLTTGMRHFRH
jgi:phosphoribosylaminoimidazolecarboxamide formyltransferase/IMP cyclohydrolase